MEGKTNFWGAYRLSGTGNVECLEINDVACNLKQFDSLNWPWPAYFMTDLRHSPPWSIIRLQQPTTSKNWREKYHIPMDFLTSSTHGSWLSWGMVFIEAACSIPLLNDSSAHSATCLLGRRSVSLEFTACWWDPPLSRDDFRRLLMTHLFTVYEASSMIEVLPSTFLLTNSLTYLPSLSSEWVS